eukprot:5506752-Karenia_brevis.AAC.1
MMGRASMLSEVSTTDAYACTVRVYSAPRKRWYANTDWGREAPALRPRRTAAGDVESPRAS